MKLIIKKIAQWLAMLLILPIYLLLRASELFVNTDQPFQGCSQLLRLIPGVPWVTISGESRSVGGLITHYNVNYSKLLQSFNG